MKKKSCKLSTQQKCEIKRRALAGEKRYALAAEFGVNETTISYHIKRARLG